MSLENYVAAIEDIEEALSNDYPEDLQHKLLERQVKCLLQTNKPLEAVKICRLALEKSDVLQQKKIEASFKQLLSKAEAILSDNCFQGTVEFKGLFTQKNPRTRNPKNLKNPKNPRIFFLFRSEQLVEFSV